MFEIIVGLQRVGSYKSFNEALIKFFEEIGLVIQKGTSYQWLETSNFVAITHSSEPTDVMNFYDARDFACEIGLLVKGKIQRGVPEPKLGVVLQAFKECAEKKELAELNLLVKMVEDLLKVAAKF